MPELTPHSVNTCSKQAQTVLGPVAVEALGITLPHEHLLLDMSIWFELPEDPALHALAQEPVRMENLGWILFNQYNCLDNVSLLDEPLAIQEAALFRDAGGGTIVDVTTVGLSPDRSALRRIARATGLHIVAGTGYYVQVGDAAAAFDRRDAAEIAVEMTRDLLEGSGEEGIRAGIIGEIGCSWPLLEREKKALRAAAEAQRQTGAAITIHPGRGEDSPLEILRVLEKAGADLSKVIMGHIDRIGFEPSTSLEILSTGCCIEYDLFGSNPFYPLRFGVFRRPCDRERIEQIQELIAAGYLGRILVSQDVCLKTKLVSYGGPGYAHILQNIVPQMIARGINREQINAIMIENPARLLGFLDGEGNA